MSTDMGMGMGSGMDPMGTADPGMSQMPQSGSGHSAVAQLDVIDVADNKFTALTVHGVAVTIRITGQTQFGTPTQPFSPGDLVPGAEVLARVKRASDGEFVATQITGMDLTPQPTQMSPSASPTGSGYGD
jgi:hypothetical protein